MEATAVAADSADRLSFTVFVAVAIHALVILGISFNLDDSQNIPPTLEITLAQHKSAKEVDEAQFLAKFNQEASGTKEEDMELTTDQPALFADTDIREINPHPQLQKTQPKTESERLALSTTDESQMQTAKKADKNPEVQQPVNEGQEFERPVLSPEMAALMAKLDQQRQAYAKRPRIRRLTSVATKAERDAEYLHNWTRKVEHVGNTNYPRKALNQKIFGKLRLAAEILPNGAVSKVEILKSSGFSILDNAALQIVRMASPFAPFPDEIRREVDRLEIIRTWHFEITGLKTSN